MQYYRGYDLAIASDIDLPGAMALAGPCAPDIEIARGAVTIDESLPRHGIYRGGGGLVFYDMADAARFRCEAGRMRVQVTPDASPPLVSAQLIANALPVLLWMRGDVLMHGATVQLGDGGAVAICGRSGSGKSTVLKALLAAGARCVSDDTFRAPAGGGPVSGLPGGYYEGQGADRAFHLAPPGTALASAPLAAILVLARGDRPGFERLAPTDAFAAVMRNIHRPRLPKLLGAMPAAVAGCAALARLPVFRWRRTEGRTALDEAEMDFLRAPR